MNEFRMREMNLSVVHYLFILDGVEIFKGFQVIVFEVKRGK